MLRTFLVLLFGLLLTAGSPHVAADHVGDGIAVADGAADDCCPPRPGQTDQDGDCCDYDFGQCCAPGTAVLASVSPGVARGRVNALDLQLGPPPELTRTRANGPPPTPPPIG